MQASCVENAKKNLVVTKSICAKSTIIYIKCNDKFVCGRMKRVLARMKKESRLFVGTWICRIISKEEKDPRPMLRVELTVVTLKVRRVMLELTDKKN
mmetsp:Transcript_4185/g.6297  ORF Transcript_4185/g.6297 Transcript_4185/m.6297 type:complete len:97 (+) Transcript_4185:464-754(+)